MKWLALSLVVALVLFSGCILGPQGGIDSCCVGIFEFHEFAYCRPGYLVIKFLSNPNYEIIYNVTLNIEGDNYTSYPDLLGERRFRFVGLPDKKGGDILTAEVQIYYSLGNETKFESEIIQRTIIECRESPPQASPCEYPRFCLADDVASVSCNNTTHMIEDWHQCGKGQSCCTPLATGTACLDNNGICVETRDECYQLIDQSNLPAYARCPAYHKPYCCKK
jgi:hypothetical protein